MERNYIQKSLNLYIKALSEPTRFIDWMSFNIPLTGKTYETTSLDDLKQNFWTESILWSWGFRFLGSIFELLVLALAISFVSGADSIESFSFFLEQSSYQTSFIIYFLFLGIGLIFFPLILLAGNLFSFLSMKMILGLVDNKQSSQFNLWEMIGLSNTSYFFHLVPFLGAAAQKTSQFYLLYKAIRWRLKWGKARSIAVIALPSLVIYFSIFMSIIILIMAFK